MGRKVTKVRHNSGQTPAARAASQRKYESKPEQIHNRVERNAARRKLMKAGRVHKGDGRDVDHHHGLSEGNTSSNLRVLSASANRRLNRRSKRTTAK